MGADRILVIGRQSLPSFVACVCLAWIAGAVLDAVGRSPASVAGINALGVVAIYCVARIFALSRSARDERATRLPAPTGVDSRKPIPSVLSTMLRLADPARDHRYFFWLFT